MLILFLIDVFWETTPYRVAGSGVGVLVFVCSRRGYGDFLFRVVRAATRCGSVRVEGTEKRGRRKCWDWFARALVTPMNMGSCW